MKKNYCRISILALFLVLHSLMSGCALFLVGAGAAGGYAITEDEMEGMTDLSRDRVWKTSLEVLQQRGAVTVQDKTQGRIEAIVNKSDVEVHVDQITKTTVRLRVKARKAKKVFPDLGLAQELHGQIMRKVGS